MTLMDTRLPADLPDRPLTVDDLARLFPDEDGYRYELVEGRLDVSPQPLPRHTRTQHRLAFHLENLAPDGFEVQSEPGINLNAERTHHRIPDITIAHTADFTPDRYPCTPPVLAVEVLSPESIFRDTDTKKREYAAFGIPAYWIVNPDPELPSLQELRLDPASGAYHEAAEVYGEQVFTTDVPFGITLVPHWLVADGPWKTHIAGD